MPSGFRIRRGNRNHLGHFAYPPDETSQTRHPNLVESRRRGLLLFDETHQALFLSPSVAPYVAHHRVTAGGARSSRPITSVRQVRPDAWESCSNQPNFCDFVPALESDPVNSGIETSQAISKTTRCILLSTADKANGYRRLMRGWVHASGVEDEATDPMANASCNKSTIAPRLPNGLSEQLFGNAAPRRLQAGEALFVAGDPGDGCYRLEQGLLKVVITSPQGDERILAMLEPGTIVGELAMIDGLPRSSSIFAARDCELSFISREAFEECTNQHPEVYRYLTSVLAARLRGTDESVAAVSFLTIRERLARALIELGDLLGEADEAGRIVINHKISQSDLAAMAGVARENVSRVMSDWKRRRVVTRSKGYYSLNSVESLRRKVGVAKAIRPRSQGRAPLR